MNYYVVIDTNVLVSALLKHNSIPGAVIDLAFDGPITPVLNAEIVPRRIVPAEVSFTPGCN